MEHRRTLVKVAPNVLQSNTQSRFSLNSPSPRKSHRPQAQRRFHSHIRYRPKHPHGNPLHTSPSPTHQAPRLIPLISKFEELDAASLSLSVRNAQPTHLRLPRSRMGRQDIGDMKATREKLLNLFERPGWGANTLRGFNNISYVSGRGSSRTNIHETADQSMSLSDANDKAKWLPKPRPSGRRESKIQEKIRFFDRTTHSPSKLSSFSSTATPCRYPLSSPKKAVGLRTPRKSYGELRSKGITPSPRRPRKWREDAHLPHSPDIIDTRSPPRERFRHALVTPPPSNIAAVVRKVQIIHQDPKRNISEKISVLYAANQGENEIEEFPLKTQEKGPNNTIMPRQSIAKKQFADEGEAGARDDLWVTTTPARSMERTPLVKENSIRDRIEFFSNNSYPTRRMGAPIDWKRNNSSPIKLPSQTVRLNQDGISNKVPSPAPIGEEQTAKSIAQATAPTSTDQLALDRNLEHASDLQSLELYTSELKIQRQSLSKPPRLNEKIKKFEAFAGGQQASIQSIPLDSTAVWPSAPSKRNRTWPIPAGEKAATTLDAEHTTAPLAPPPRERTQHSGIEAEKGNERRRDRIRQREWQKSQHSRQERLKRRPRSRSRSAPSASRPVERRRWEEWSKTETSLGQGGQQEDWELEDVMELDIMGQEGLDTIGQEECLGGDSVQEIWIDGSDDGSSGGTWVVDTVVAQCELAEPRPLRLAETMRMIRLCRGRFAERDRRSENWKRKLGSDSEKSRGLAV